MDGHTDIGRWTEWNEMNMSLAVPKTVIRNGEEQEVMAFPQFHAMETWHERYPDEMWAVYVRPSTQESGVRPVGMTPVFTVLLSPTDRFADEHLDSIHYGSYGEMREVLRGIQHENILLSKPSTEGNA